MNPSADTGDAPLLATLRAEHRRVLGLFRPLEASHDDFERIELVSVLCEEIRHLLTAERCVVQPLVEEAGFAERALPAATDDDRLRQAALLDLVERLEQLSPEEADFDVLSRHAYDGLRVYVCGQERDLFPLLARLTPPQLERADRRLQALRGLALAPP